MDNNKLNSAKSLFAQKDYTNAYLELSECSSESVLRFIKSTECLEVIDRHKKHKGAGIKSFWLSPIPTTHFDFLFKADIAEYLLLSLLSNEKHFSDKLIGSLFEKLPKQTIQFIKLTKIFEKEAFLSFILTYKRSSNLNLQRFAREIDFISKLAANWNKEQIFHDSIIIQTSYEDILIQAIAYFEKFKRSSKIAFNNSDEVTSRRVNLCYVLNYILEIKRNYTRSNNKPIVKAINSIPEFIQILEHELPPINPIEGILGHKYLPTEDISYNKQLLRDSIEFYFSKLHFDNVVNAYCCGFIDFELIDNLEGEIITTDLDKILRRNDQKNRFPERLAINKVEISENFQFLKPLEKQVELSFKVFHNYFNYLKIPFKTTTRDKKEIDLEKVFLILQSFSDFLMPEGRHLHKDESGRVNQFQHEKPKRFNNYFKQSYLCSFSETDLINGISRYFDWSKDESKLLIDYLTLDLKSIFKIDFLLRPLIKIENHYFWLSSLMKKQKWSELLYTRIAIDKTLKHLVQTPQIEKALSEEFIKAGFNAVCSKCYGVGEDNGEIDVIAFSDNCLFLIELKTTFNSENFIRNALHFTRQVSTKARNQLNSAIEYIRSDDGFQEIKGIENLKIPSSSHSADIKIIPLIVTNIFDYDDIVIDGKFLNISMFELMVILNNDLYNLQNINTEKLTGKLANQIPDLPVDIINSFGNESNMFNKHEKFDTSKEKCSLWSGNELTVNDFLTAIKEDKVWQFLDKMKVFPTIQMKIGIYDKSINWLI